jgi:D-methionine transport system permease protein
LKEDFAKLILQGLGETMYMVVIAGIISSIMGITLGILLVVTDKNGIHPVIWFHKIANVIINRYPD